MAKKSENHIENSSNVVINSTINAQGDVIIGGTKVTNIYISSNYERLVERRKEYEEWLADIPESDLARRYKVSGKLNEVNDSIEEYKGYVLRLAETFSNIKVYDERLTKARSLFEEGKFEEIDELLSPKALDSEYTSIEKEKRELKNKAEILADTYLVKAQVLALGRIETDQYKDIAGYYERAIRLSPSTLKLIELTEWLQSINQHQLSINILEGIWKARKEPTHPFATGCLAKHLGNLYKKIKDWEQAAHYLQIAIPAFDELERLNLPGFEKGDFYAKSLNDYGLLLFELTRYEEARDYLKAALDQFKKSENQDDPKYLESVALIQNNLSTIYRKLQSVIPALGEAHRARDNYHKLYEINKEKYGHDYSMALITISNVFIALKLSQKAIPCLEEALEIRTELAERNPLAFMISKAEVYHTLSYYYQDCEPDKEKSLIFSKEALKIYQHFYEYQPSLKTQIQKLVLILQGWNINLRQFLTRNNLKPLLKIISTK